MSLKQPKKTTTKEVFFRGCFLGTNDLSLLNCAHGAYTSAGTAVNTLIFIDDILAITSRNAAYGTFALTCATANAFISNYMCH